MTEELRVLVAAHDPESRAGLERLCQDNGLQTLPAADTGAFALQLARMLTPDLVLVDTDLSDMTGLQLLEELKPDNLAGVVVTARTDLAVRAYETGALDYVVKPVSNRRFLQAIARARVWLCAAAARGRAAGGTHCVLVGERQHRLYLLDPGRIDYVEAEGNYVIFHAASREYLSRDTLKRLELTLQACGFLRIENSLLLNVGAIDYAVPFGRGRFVFTLRSGMTLRSTLTHRAGILKRLPLVRGRR
jgi:two-component system LytT family response regulator